MNERNEGLVSLGGKHQSQSVDNINWGHATHEDSEDGDDCDDDPF